ncbi:MAG: hypothetical protein HYS36_02690 [Candidatus Rokubacteria bacterium]|nr:hypothetical protein [Candidatus Rokubacteria bacterium]
MDDVLDRSDLAVRDRPPRYTPSGVPVRVDLLVCTQAELERELAAANPFVKRIIAESLVLFRCPASQPAD